MALAGDTASALVRSHTRCTITRVVGDVARLQGTAGRRLVLGERPVTAVAAVALNGTLLDAADYRVHRSGSLWRRADGTARSRGAGDPLPRIRSRARRLAAVTRTTAARLASNPEQPRSEEVEGYSAVAAAPVGFTVGERMVLERYRRRTLALVPVERQWG